MLTSNSPFSSLTDLVLPAHYPALPNDFPEHISPVTTSYLPSSVLPTDISVTDTSSYDLLPSSDNSHPALPSNSSHDPLPDSHNFALRSSRIKRKPAYLQDYHCTLVKSLNCNTQSTMDNGFVLYPLSSYLSYSRLSPSHRAYSLAISNHVEPKSYHEAVKFSEWRDAMKAEISALESKKTWVLTELPPNKTAIGCKWVFKCKFRADRSLERHKARLVAKGYTQQEGVDFFGTFSPVAKLTIVRCLLALVAINCWELH